MGIVVIRAPEQILAEAADPEGRYPDSTKFIKDLQEDAANLQQGKSTHIILGSDSHVDGQKYLYDIDIKGISGTGGTLYNTKDLIMERKKEIYNTFGASFLLLGQSGHGSNALAGSQMTTHDHYVQRSIQWKVDVINNQLLPRLLQVNGVYLDYKDMPEFYSTDPSKVDYDTLGKLLQRAGSTELLSDEAVFYIYDQLGFPQDGLEMFLEDRKNMRIQSRAGESGGSSGIGNTQSGGASSDLNSENKSLSERSLVIEKIGDGGTWLIDTETGESVFIEDQ